MDVTIRPAVAADVAELRAVGAAAYAPYIERIGRPPAPLSADYAAAVARGEVWVATDAEAVVGLIVLVTRPGYLLLENIAVLPSGQGRGVGSQLMRLAEQQAAGLGEIRLYTNVAMTENQAYYRRHGYVETGRGKQEGFDRVYFTKRLPGQAAQTPVGPD